jgi:hypothetical protein
MTRLMLLLAEAAPVVAALGPVAGIAYLAAGLLPASR